MTCPVATDRGSAALSGARCSRPRARWHLRLAGWLLLWVIAAMPVPAQAVIVYVDAASGFNDALPSNGTSGPLTINRPSGVTPGTLLLATITQRPHGMSASVPSGWTLLYWDERTDGGVSTFPFGMRVVVYYKIAGTNEPASYTWNYTNTYLDTGMLAGTILAFHGVNTSGNPLDGSGTAYGVIDTGNGTTHATPSISTSTANTMLVATIGYLSGVAFGAPSGISGITQRASVLAGSWMSMQVSTTLRAATGATGSVSATASSDPDRGMTHLMALRPSNTDLSLAMTRGSSYSAGGTASYTLTASNVGSASEPGPLTVVNTLPTGLTYSSASGTGWSCSAAGQTVTCSRTGSVAAGASAPALTINASVANPASGTFVNSASVYGTGGDAAMANNTTSDSYTMAAALYASYAMDETTWGTITDGSGSARHASALGSATPTGPTVPSPPGSAIAGTTGTCGFGQVPAGTTAIGVNTGINPTSLGNAGSIAFWYSGNAAWNDGNARMLFDASNDLGASDRHFFLAKTGTGALVFSLKDSAGTVTTATSAGQALAANTWHHIAVTWDLAGNSLQIYLNGSVVATSSTGTNGALGSTASLYVGAQRMAGVTGAPSGYTSNTANGAIDELAIYSGPISAGTVGALRTATHACPGLVDHVEITTTASTGLTCTPTTFTIKACSNAACSTPYTGGLTGNLALSGGGMTVNYPSGAGFSIAAGSSTTTVAAHITTVGTVTVSASGLSVAPTNGQPVFCGLGTGAAQGNSCSFAVNDSGFQFDVPDQLAETNVKFSVRAVKKSDNSLACTPAFASTTKSVNFKCSYTNPATGTLPVRIAGTALNAANNAAAACDGTGRSVSLSFDASGTADTTAMYADAGRITLTATYTGSGSDAGLTMTGTDTFIAAPYTFGISGLSASPVAAGATTAGTVTARNYAGNATPNFGRESAAESVTLGFVRAAPTGAGAVSGTFSGGVGSFSGGAATASNISYTEVGKIDVVAALTSAGYLGSSYRPAGSSHGAMVWCANEGGTCSLPAGTVNTVWYAATTHGAAFVQAGLSGSVGCNNTVFGDPWVGQAKGCWFVTTSGVHSANTGALTLRPNHFDLTATAACPAGAFTYAGQPYSVTVTARNLGGATTVNYDGSAATTPNQAQAVTLADANGLGLGTLSGHNIAATAFTAGVATATPTYSFTSKETAAQSLVLRATDPQGTSSSGYTEPAMALRSGRLRMSNAFGKASAALQLTVAAEYWSGNSWVLNSGDSCTTLPAASVVLSNARDARGASSAASTSASAVSLSAGRGTLTLAAPTPAGQTLSVDLALNLGSTTTDQSCLASHPASTGAARPWLRSRNGSCSSAWDRDPAARASFGVYAPETRKVVHIRELF